MGLDAVEIVMDVEDRFGITITDDEAGRVRTVGGLVAIIRSRVDAIASTSCFALPAFLSLRRLVRNVVGDSSFRVRPSQSVAYRLSPAHRRELWRRLPELLGTLPRPLRYPQPLRVLLICLSVLSVGAAIGIAAVDWAILPLTILLAYASIFLLYLATSRLRTVPQEGMVTLGDITRRIVGRTVATSALVLPDDSAILAELRPIVVGILGVESDEVVLDARFVEDLDMD